MTADGATEASAEAVEGTILFIDEFPAFGGGQVVLKNCMEALGVSRCLLVRPSWCRDPGHWPCRTIPCNFPQYPKTLSNPLVFLRFAPRMLAAGLWLRKLLRKEKPARIVVNSFFSLMPVRIALLFFPNRPPLTLYVHSSDNIPWNPVSRRLLRQCDQILACCQAAMRGIPVVSGKPAGCAIIYNGVPTVPDRAPRKKPGTPLTLGFLGRFSEEKNLFALVEAVKRLHQEIPCRLILGGDGPMAEPLMDYVKTEQIPHVVSFPGWVEDKEEFFRKIDVFCLCSLREAFPMALLEAQAWGIPAVATRVGGIPEIVEDGVSGVLAPSPDAEDIFDTLKRFLQADYSRMSSQALAKAGRFDLKRVFQPRTRQVFQQEGGCTSRL